MRGRFRTLAKVLVFLLLSAVFTVGLAVKIGNIQLFAHDYSLSAVFTDAAGVFKGDDVKLAGVDVGRVTGTSIEDGKAVVRFTLDKDVKLTTDSIVAIRWRNVLGLRFLYVYPGDGGGRELHAGDVVPVTHTQDAGDIGKFLNELGPILQAINPNEANAFLQAVNEALGGSEVAIRELLDSAAVLSTSLGSKDRDIGRLVKNSATVLSAYASQSRNIGTILDDLDILGAKLAGINGQIDSLVTNFADVQQQLDRILVKNRGNIDATLSDLQSVAGTLDANRVNLARTLCSLPTGLAPYYETSSWGQWFNVRVTEIVFKDQSGAPISSADETSEQRGPGPQHPVTCGGAPSLQKGHRKGTAAAASTPSGGSSLRAFVESVTASGTVG
jgi:phospholipid/cholesterol/gamma-HCH transport system substrate-binding protein